MTKDNLPAPFSYNHPSHSFCVYEMNSLHYNHVLILGHIKYKVLIVRSSECERPLFVLLSCTF